MSRYTKAVVAMLVAWLAAPVTVTAQLSRPQFGVAAGATFPIGGDFHAGLYEFKRGWQGMALVAFRIRHLPVGLRLDGSYGANTSSLLPGTPGPRRFGLLGGDADLTLTFPSPSRAKVYVLAGPGLYRVSYTSRSYSGAYDVELTKGAYNLGGGITVGVLFVEARYVHVGLGNTLSYILVPITAGLRLGG